MRPGGLRELFTTDRETNSRGSVTEEEVEERKGVIERNNKEPVTKVRVRGELGFDEEFLLPQMGSKVCLFFVKQFLTLNKPPAILPFVEWSEMTFQSECSRGCNVVETA